MTINAGEVVEKTNPSQTDGENANGEATLENSLEVPQKVKQLPCDMVIPYQVCGQEK